MGDLDLYQRNDALPHSYTLKRDEPINSANPQIEGSTRNVNTRSSRSSGTSKPTWATEDSPGEDSPQYKASGA